MIVAEYGRYMVYPCRTSTGPLGKMQIDRCTMEQAQFYGLYVRRSDGAMKFIDLFGTLERTEEIARRLYAAE